MKKLFPAFALVLIVGLLVWSFRLQRSAQKNVTTISPPAAASGAQANHSSTTAPTAVAAVSEMAAHGQIIGTQWTQESSPALRAFSGWTEKFVAADAGGRLTLLPEGITLAQARRTALKI